MDNSNGLDHEQTAIDNYLLGNCAEAGRLKEKVCVTGSKTELSLIDIGEEYFRSLSCQNYLTEETVSHLIHHEWYLRFR